MNNQFVRRSAIDKTKMSFKEQQQIIFKYFRQAADSIQYQNKEALGRVCRRATIVYSILLFVAFFILPIIEVRPAYVLAIPGLLIIYALNSYLMKNKEIPPIVTSITCLTFYFVFSLFLVMLDTVLNPDKQTLWIPLFMMLFPSLYINKLYQYAIEELIMMGILIYFSYSYKSHEQFINDIYVVIAAHTFSLIMAQSLLVLRSQEALAILELSKLGTVDMATGVYNKGTFTKLAEDYLSNTGKDEPCTLCMIDVDNFKQVNDAYGHTVGDNLLSHLGKELSRIFDTEAAFPGRFGGDEFVVLLPGTHDENFIKSCCNELEASVHNFKAGNDTEFSISVGAFISDKKRPFEELFDLADKALYESKDKGKSCITIHKN